MKAHRQPKRKRKRNTTRTCHGKKRYRDQHEAQVALRTVARRFTGADKMPVRTYECPHCHGWHLTARESW